MARLYAMLFFVELALAIIALISCLSAEEGEVRALPRLAWVLVILIFPLVGAIAYLLVGRPVTTASRSLWRVGGGFPETSRPKRPLAPDDDPEFLRAINEKTAREDEALLRRWEEDLRRREEDLRKREGSADGSPATDG